jgi:dienelactone hydrolase
VTTGKTRGIVLVAHGGQDHSTAPVTASQLAVLRMIPIASAIRNAVAGDAIDVRRPLFKVRGWNGAEASPVGDLIAVLDDIAARSPGVPVILIGHSMGARAAFRVAGHPVVVGVAGLAPWLPPGEPAGQLVGRRVLLVHGTADRITRPADTWAYAERARAVSEPVVIEIRGGDHPMIRRALLWHAIATEFTRAAFGLPAGGGEAAVAVNASARAKTVTLW